MNNLERLNHVKTVKSEIESILDDMKGCTDDKIYGELKKAVIKKANQL